MFTNHKWYTTVNTVQDLIRELELLPPLLSVKQGEGGVDAVIFNRDRDDMYLSFEPGGEWSKLLEGEQT